MSFLPKPRSLTEVVLDTVGGVFAAGSLISGYHFFSQNPEIFTTYLPYVLQDITGIHNLVNMVTFTLGSTAFFVAAAGERSHYDLLDSYESLKAADNNFHESLKELEALLPQSR